MEGIEQDAFDSDLQSSTLYTNPSEDISVFFYVYNQTLHSLLDKHVPTKEVVVRSRPTSHGLTTAVGTRKSPQDDLNGVTGSRISRTTIVHGVSSSSVNGSFSSWSTRLTGQELSTAAPTPSQSGRRLTLYFIQCCPRLFRTPQMILIVISPSRSKLFESPQPLPPPPTINRRDVPPFPGFTSMTVEEVSRIICDTSNKQCELDLIPTWLVKKLCDALTSVITAMANASFTQGRILDTQTRHRPSSTQEAFIRPD